MVEIHITDIIPLIGIPDPPNGRPVYNISCPYPTITLQNLCCMNNVEFETVLRNAIAGSEKDLELIFELYEPLIYKYSCIKGEYNEDMHQQLLLHIALNIHKFPV